MTQLGPHLDRLKELSRKLSGWANTYSPSREGSARPISRNLTADSLRLDWSAGDWKEAIRKPRLGLYGPSQAGKSTFIRRLFGVDTPFLTDLTVSFLKDVNPSGEGIESTAIPTRFVLGKKGDQPYLLLGRRADLLAVLAFGFHIVAEFEADAKYSPPIDPAQLETLEELQEAATGGCDGEDEIWSSWRDDILRAYWFSQCRFGSNHFPIPFHVLVHALCHVKGLADGPARSLASRLLWRNSEGVSGIYKEVVESGILDVHRLTAPWSAAKLLLTRILPADNNEPIIQVDTQTFGDQKWADYELKKGPDRLVRGRGGSDLEGWKIHSLAEEFVVPIDGDRIERKELKIFEKFDVVDFPGTRRPAKQYVEKQLEDPSAHMNLAERGRIDYSFISLGSARPLDVMVFLQNYRNSESEVSKLITSWCRFWREPDGVEPEPPPLIAGVTFFDRILAAFDKKGAPEVHRFFEGDFIFDFMKEAERGPPFRKCFWLAMSDTPMKAMYPEPHRARIRQEYLKCTPIAKWISNLEEKWNLLFEGEDGECDGVLPILKEVLDVEPGSLQGKIGQHIRDRLESLRVLLQAALPATASVASSVPAAERVKRTVSLAREWLQSGQGLPSPLALRKFDEVRQAFEFPAVKQANLDNTVPPEERLLLWKKDLIRAWASKALPHLIEVGPAFTKRWEEVVGWLVEALSGPRIDDVFLRAMKVIGTKDQKIVTRFAATLLNDYFYWKGRGHEPRKKVGYPMNSSTIRWEEWIAERWINSIAWLAQESASVNTVHLDGDDDGLKILSEIEDLLSKIGPGENGRGETT